MRFFDLSSLGNKKKIMVQDLALVQFSSICLICQNPTKYWGYKNQSQGTSLFAKIYAIAEKYS